MIDAVYFRAPGHLYYPAQAAAGLAPHRVPEVLLIMGDHRDHFVDISPTFERKLRAVRAHASQWGKRQDIEGFFRRRAESMGEAGGLPLAEASNACCPADPVLTWLRQSTVALPLSFAWEMLQMPAFTGLPESFFIATAWCAAASLGDVAIILAVFVTSTTVFANNRWFTPPRPGRYTVAVLIGVLLNVAAEWVLARGAGLWGHAPWHLVVPVVNVGVLAVIQPIVLVPLSFSLLADGRGGRRDRASSRTGCVPPGRRAPPLASPKFLD